MRAALNRRLEASRQGGFTLIELLIVIVILGILAAIVVFAVGGITDKGNKAACKSDLKSVETAVEAYKAQNSSYPPAGYGSLVPSFLREQPPTDKGYTITVGANGAVTASPDCDSVTG